MYNKIYFLKFIFLYRKKNINVSSKQEKNENIYKKYKISPAFQVRITRTQTKLKSGSLWSRQISSLSSSSLQFSSRGTTRMRTLPALQAGQGLIPLKLRVRLTLATTRLGVDSRCANGGTTAVGFSSFSPSSCSGSFSFSPRSCSS